MQKIIATNAYEIQSILIKFAEEFIKVSNNELCCNLCHCPRWNHRGDILKSLASKPTSPRKCLSSARGQHYFLIRWKGRVIFGDRSLARWLFFWDCVKSRKKMCGSSHVDLFFYFCPWDRLNSRKKWAVSKNFVLGPGPWSRGFFSLA